MTAPATTPPTSPLAAPLRLTPSLQHYAWGDPHFIPQVLGLPPSAQPCAEAWYGAHPLAPATVQVADHQQRLDQLIAAHPETLLGSEVHTRFAGLPYLLKLLAANKPLSIQVHPNLAQAEAGFAREERAGIAQGASTRCYKDANHKPEVIVALTPFYALCGFKPFTEIASLLDGLPEVKSLLPPFERSAQGLHRLLEAYFALPRLVLESALGRVVERLAARAETQPFELTEPSYWVLHAHRELCTDGKPDRGLLFVFLLELLQLQPGQGLFLPAGVPHAYLQGAGVELMASSDNVLRAGLTPKHVDVAELLALVRTDASAPPLLELISTEDGNEGTYPLPVREFDLRQLRLERSSAVTRQAHGPETLLALPDHPDTRVEVVTDAGRLALGPGQACLLAHATHYRLESTGPARVFRVRLPGAEAADDYRGTRPTHLTFGTSGLRGLISDITDLEAYINARGFLNYLIAQGDAVPGTPLALAGDLRPSTDGPERSILRAVARAVRDAGLVPIYCGRLPTPALTYFGLHRGCPSIMVTGSHIPFDRNGIKFNSSRGEVLKSDEAPILESVARVRALEYGRAASGSPFDDAGYFRSGQSPALPEVDPRAYALYVHRYWDAFPPGALSGLRLGLFEHSMVGREIVAEILRGLGASVYPVGRSQSFVAIDTEAISDTHLAELQQLADRVQAEYGPVDAVVSTDGDSDRPLLLGIDAQGRVHFFSGDVLGVVVASYLEADVAVVPISSNDLIEDYLVPRGTRVVKTRIGSPWVIAAMARETGARCVGWEANGGFLTGTPVQLEHGTLAPLPTRDAVLPLVAVLHAAVRAHQPVVEVFRALPQRFGKSGLLDEVPCAASRAILEAFAPGDARVQSVRFESDAVFWSDATGREQLAEQALQRRWLAQRQALGECFNEARGFGALESINYLDGLRMTFSARGAEQSAQQATEVAHVRPSGNAPQLRIYALANSEARAQQIVNLALAEADGLLPELMRVAQERQFVSAVERNLATTEQLFQSGEPPAVLATVAGSAAAQRFWQNQLDSLGPALRAERAVSLHEDLPVGQALGLLLLWQRLRSVVAPGKGALAAFVFGEGSRAAPFTEAECGQKAALASFVAVETGAGRRYLSITELALRHFCSVEHYLRKSGFDGVVVKWGDEVQVPALDLSGSDARFADADVVRFVSLQAMTPDTALNKDWVGVDASGRITAFIPRRPLPQMQSLAERGLVQRRGEALWGGINLGSIALSRKLLDALLEEFDSEVNDPHAQRAQRPDLDPQFFTALTLATLDDATVRSQAFTQAKAESPALQRLDGLWPELLGRLRGVVERFQSRHGRPVQLVAMDFGNQYWADIGQHRQMFEQYMALGQPGAEGQIARALAGVPETCDALGNRIGGGTRLGADVRVRHSVLIDVRVATGSIEDCVLVGTRAGSIQARQAFDIQSTVATLALGARAGSYKLVSDAAVQLQAGERATTVFLPDTELLMRVHEDTDLRDRDACYDVPTCGNALSFQQVHAQVTASDPEATEARRAARQAEVQARLPVIKSEA